MGLGFYMIPLLPLRPLLPMCYRIPAANVKQFAENYSRRNIIHPIQQNAMFFFSTFMAGNKKAQHVVPYIQSHEVIMSLPL